MTLQEHRKKHLRLAIPVMTSQLGQIAVGFADTVMVGQLGTTELGTVGLCNSLQSLFLLFGIGMSYGITPLVAEADGANNYGRSWYMLRHGSVVCLLTGLGLTGLGVAMLPLLPFLNQPAAVVALSGPYFLVLAVSWIPMMLFQSYRQFTEGLSFTRQAMYISISGNLLNIALNYLFIFGKFGVPALGIMGAGYATLISRCFMAAAMMGYVHLHRRFQAHRQAGRSQAWSVRGLRAVLQLGFPTAIQYTFEVSAFSATALMMGWLGENTLAAHQIVINLSAITYLMVTGLASATAIRVGNQLGRRDYTTLRLVGWMGNRLSFFFMGIWALVFILFRHQLPLLYNPEPAVLEIAASLLIVAGIFQLPDGIQAASMGALRGMHDVRRPTLITLMAYWLLAIPSGYLFGFTFQLGPSGIWTGLVVGLTAAALLLAWRFHRLTLLRIRQNPTAAPTHAPEVSKRK